MIGKDSCYERMWNCHYGNGSHSSQEVELKRKKKRWSESEVIEGSVQHEKEGAKRNFSSVVVG